VKWLTLKDAATIMISVSDNVAANLLIDLLGMEKIQQAIRSWGLTDTKLQRKMMDLESVAQGRANLLSPYDMMVALEKIADAEILDRNSCEIILDILSRTEFLPGLRIQIPENIVIQHKTGDIADVCNDVGIVRIPGNPFIICVMTKGASVAERWKTIGEVGKAFYDHLTSMGEKRIE